MVSATRWRPKRIQTGIDVGVAQRGRGSTLSYAHIELRPDLRPAVRGTCCSQGYLPAVRGTWFTPQYTVYKFPRMHFAAAVKQLKAVLIPALALLIHHFLKL